MRLIFVGFSGLTPDHPEVKWVDEMATTLGALCLSLVGLRVRRGLPLLAGYPRSCVLAGEEEHCDGFLQRLRRDLGIFRGNNSPGPPTARHKRAKWPQRIGVRTRSVCPATPVRFPLP